MATFIQSNPTQGATTSFNMAAFKKAVQSEFSYSLSFDGLTYKITRAELIEAIKFAASQNKCIKCFVNFPYIQDNPQTFFGGENLFYLNDEQSLTQAEQFGKDKGAHILKCALVHHPKQSADAKITAEQAS